MTITYTSDIQLGERYRDVQTGYEGTATAIAFYQYACERITLEAFDPSQVSIRYESFDAPRLISVKTGEVATATRPGGPLDVPAQRNPTRR